jgi:uncharacterized protein
MSKTFVKDPREVVKSGDVVRVKVLDVDVPRKRISLTLRLDDESGTGGGPRGGGRSERGGGDGGIRRGGGSSGHGSPGGAGRDGGSGGGAGRDGGSRSGAGQGGQSRQGRGGSGGPVGGGAMADALRRAGLDKGRDGTR